MGRQVLWQEIVAGTVKMQVIDDVLRVTCYVAQDPKPPPPPNTGRARYVDSARGNDRNNGDFDSPWRTIARANSQLVAGDTCYIRGGTYKECIEPANGGTADEPIWYTNYKDEMVRISGNNAHSYVAKLRRPYIALNGLHLARYDGKGGDGAKWLDITADHGSVQNCTIGLSRNPRSIGGERLTAIAADASFTRIEANQIIGMTFGIKISGRFNVIRSNEITQMLRDCINPLAEPKHTIHGLLIEGNRIDGSVMSDGIQWRAATDLGGTITNYGTIVRNNFISGHGENMLDLKSCRYVLIEGNTFCGNSGNNDGGLVDGDNRRTLSAITKGANQVCSDIIIRRNVFYDCASGVNLCGNRFKIYHNTFVANNRDYTGPDSNHVGGGKSVFKPVSCSSTYDDNVIINNIFANHNSAEHSQRLLTGFSALIDHNVYYNKNGAVFSTGRDGNFKTHTFSSWKTALGDHRGTTGDDANSQEADPEFAKIPDKPVSGQGWIREDFDLLATSPALNAARPLCYTTSAGTGTTVKVDDAGLFCDGFGIADGDSVIIGKNRAVTVVTVDYAGNKITVDQKISWKSDDAIHIGEYVGDAPDIGALEHGWG